MPKTSTITILQAIGISSTEIIRRGESQDDLVLDTDGRFFKNRSWLRLEFPELIARTEADVSRS